MSLSFKLLKISKNRGYVIDMQNDSEYMYIYSAEYLYNLCAEILQFIFK